MLAWMVEMFFLLVIFVLNMSLTMVFIKDQNSEIFYAMLLAGREFFVGLSHFTNEAGARAVAAAFPEYPCVPIKVI